MHFAILQKWKGDDTFTLLFQAPKEKEDELDNTLLRLRKDAHKRKVPVEYKKVELDGLIEAPITEKDQGKRKIVISQGTFKGLEFYLEKDETND